MSKTFTKTKFSYTREDRLKARDARERRKRKEGKLDRWNQDNEGNVPDAPPEDEIRNGEIRPEQQYNWVSADWEEYARIEDYN